MRQATHQWYLIGRNGEVLRVRSGMSLGENAAGELSFDPACGQLELESAGDGGVVIIGAADHELESGAGKRCRRVRLAADSRAEIRMPNNILRLDTDFADPQQGEESVEIRVVRPTVEGAVPQITSPEPPRSEVPESVIASRPSRGELADAILAVRPPESRTSVSAAPPVISPREIPRIEPTHGPARETPRTELKPGPARETPQTELKHSPARESSPIEPKHGVPRPQPAPYGSGRNGQLAGSADVRGHRPRSRLRILSPSMAALIAFAAIGFALMNSTLDGDRAPESSASDAVDPLEQRDPPESRFTVGEDAASRADAPRTADSYLRPAQPLAETTPSVTDASEQVAQRPGPTSSRLVAPGAADARVPPAGPADARLDDTVGTAEIAGLEPQRERGSGALVPKPGAADVSAQPPAVERADVARGGGTTITPRPSTSVPPPDTSVAARREQAPAAAQTTGRDSTPQVGQTIGSSPVVASAPKTRSQTNSPVAANPPEANGSAEALDTEDARRRALRAADLALAQGRLTSPSEANAYTLYQRVLALDPGSAEAKRGLQSVRQELINRALAQLAGNALDEARKSLQAAEAVGANPLLVADLRREIDFRQRVTGGR